ncbi:MAG: Rpn family recombination-promoting nuclease/putative transposase, partial [Planctomycetes bacterium]|nr:Rpn family recombination-promoting nuclease/putative transposase [Planctomycetota bacterium]
MRSPHDRLFSFTFRNAQHAACWLQSVLPPLLTAAIDWTTLTPLRERFPGVRLRPHLADAGFAAQLDLAGEAHPIALLIEHKSHDDAEVEQQLLRYTIHLRRALQQQLGRPPFVVPVLLRHGEPRRPTPPPGGPLHDLL